MLTATFFSAVLKPTPRSLWRLRLELLAADVSFDSPAMQTLQNTFEFLTELEARLTAQGFTELASILDMSAVGAVALQNLVEADRSSDEFWKRFLLGVLSEGLIIMASRQYIKGAKAEVQAQFQKHAWIVYEALWRLSADQQPDLDNHGRRHTLDQLFQPIWDDETEPMTKAALLGRLYQALLLVHLSRENIELETNEAV